MSWSFGSLHTILISQIFFLFEGSITPLIIHALNSISTPQSSLLLIFLFPSINCVLSLNIDYRVHISTYRIKSLKIDWLVFHCMDLHSVANVLWMDTSVFLFFFL